METYGNLASAPKALNAVKSSVDCAIEHHHEQATRLSDAVSKLYQRLGFVLHSGGADEASPSPPKPCSSSPLVKFIDDSADEIECQCNRLDDILSRLPT